MGNLRKKKYQTRGVKDLPVMEPVRPSNPSDTWGSWARRGLTGDTELDLVNDSIYNKDMDRYSEEMSVISRAQNEQERLAQIAKSEAEARALAKAEKTKFDEAERQRIGLARHKAHLAKIKQQEIDKVRAEAAARAAAHAGTSLGEAGQNLLDDAARYRHGGARARSVNGRFKSGGFLSTPRSYDLDED